MSTRWSDCCEKVTKLIDIVDDMTEWEHQFINDMVEIEDAGGLFTPPQMDKIEEIYDRYEKML